MQFRVPGNHTAVIKKKSEVVTTDESEIFHKSRVQLYSEVYLIVIKEILNRKFWQYRFLVLKSFWLFSEEYWSILAYSTSTQLQIRIC